MQKRKQFNPVIQRQQELNKARFEGFVFGTDMTAVAMYNVNLNGKTKAQQIVAVEDEISRIVNDEFGGDFELAVARWEPALKKIREEIDNEQR